MQHTPGDSASLQQQLMAASHSDDVIAVLNDLAPLLSEQRSSRAYYTLLVDIFQALRALTVEDPTEGEYLIDTHLLDYLEQESNDGTAIQLDATRQLRECLEEWMAQYPEETFVALRQHILDKLLARFQEKPSPALCWTFAHIGYRDERLVEALWHYASSAAKEEEEQDTALVTLTALGVPDSARAQLLKALHQRLQRHVTVPLLIALQRLASGKSVRVIQKTCFAPSSRSQKAEVLRERPLILSTLAAIADAHEHVNSLQDQVWGVISEQYTLDPKHVAYAVNLGWGLAERCNSGTVVANLVEWIGQAVTEELEQQRLPLLLYRLEECVRPRQIAGWQQTAHQLAIPVLRKAACRNTHSTGRYATHEMHTKEAAWGTILRQGHRDALGWFDEAVSEESNPYLRGQLCDLFASFRLLSLPRTVTRAITQDYDAQTRTPDTTGNVSAEIAIRLGAIKVARSTASREAFEALLNCGLTLYEQPLLVAVRALADVARFLARQGERDFVVERLVETIVYARRPASRLAAARALELLAHEQQIAPSLLEPLSAVLMAWQDIDAYLLSILLSCLALQQFFPNKLIPLVEKWAEERNDELALQSFSLLASRGWLREKPTLLQRLDLGLASKAEERGTDLRADWQARILMMLYQRDPESSMAYLTDLISSQFWFTAVQALGKARKRVGPARQVAFPREHVAALIEHVHHYQTQQSVDGDIIRLVANLIPDDFAGEAWYTTWQTWFPDARTALGDTLGNLGPLGTLSAASTMQQLYQLTHLTWDGQYAVRRAAYRGLLNCTPSLLLEWCRLWSKSDNRLLRLRAAEACAWLPQEKLFQGFFNAFECDPEPEVRQTAARCRLERRKRLWARHYLQRVKQVADDGMQSNADVLSAWPSAEALTRVGDDTTLEALQTLLESRTLPPHLSHWYQSLQEKTREGWEKALKKWPQPREQWSGYLEQGHGTIRDDEVHSVPVMYVVMIINTHEDARGTIWGGIVQSADLSVLSHNSLPTLRLEGGRQGTILFQSVAQSATYALFHGQGHLLL